MPEGTVPALVKVTGAPFVLPVAATPSAPAKADPPQGRFWEAQARAGPSSPAATSACPSYMVSTRLLASTASRAAARRAGSLKAPSRVLR